MACVVCAANVENTLRKLRGVNSATVTLSTRTVLVDYDPDVITLDDMKREVSNAGYDLVVENDRNAEEINRREYTLLRRRTLLSWLFAALTMYFGMSGDGTFNNQICLILALLNMFYCGRRFYVSAAKQITHRTANMDSLVALSTLIAFLFSTFNTFFGEAVWGARGIEWHTYFDASVMIITFVLTGRCLEEKAKDSTASSIRQLMVGIGKAAQKQILIKDASALENLHKIQALVVDKTGTLTIPNPNIDFTRPTDIPLEERETLKPNAKEAMAALQRAGIEVYMMSGDKEEAAHYWAAEAGIRNYRSKVLPGDKQALVQQLQSEGKRVAMVGDGINDTQALALADVGIAIGRGTDVAMDVAQITLMGDDLMALPEAVKLSRRTVRMIWQNLFWAFVYNLVCIPLAAGALHIFGVDFQITPMWASALMAFSSVSVVLNSLRLRYA